MNGSDLLNEFRTTRSETAFANLVRAYADLVYSVAKRRLGVESLAQDAAQIVFTRIAQNPPRIKEEPALVAWLHRTAIHVAIDLWRSETRRRNREQEAVSMQPDPVENSASVWQEMAPQLDEALDSLAEEERQVVLLRFFEGKAMREIGQCLGVSEDAAKMRVSRAVARLRDRLANRGVVCAPLMLTALLRDRAIENTPAHVLAALVSVKAVIPAAGPLVRIMDSLRGVMPSKVILGTGAVVIVSGLALLLATKHRTGTDNQSSEPVPVQVKSTEPEKGPRRMTFTPANPLPPQAQPNGRIFLRVIDKETGAGIPGVNIQAPYFYAGGVGEPHNLQTDPEGNAVIPEPNHPEQRAGANVFASVPGYVPKCVSFHGANRTNYVLELEPANTIGGIVVDEQGNPVPDVVLQASRGRDDPFNQNGPTTDFQTSKVTTDLDGRWYYPYVPKSYKEFDCHLTCSNYSVTRYIIPLGGPDAMNPRLIIRRGFVVAGRVMSAHGKPIPNTTLKEQHQYGWRKVSAQTDAEGRFELRGLGDNMMKLITYSSTVTSEEITKSHPQQSVKLGIVAEGFAPQEQSVRLIEATNTVEFILGPAQVFRGHVVDEAGNPIPGAVVGTDYDNKNQFSDPFEWLDKTDAEGKFRWTSAPAARTCFWFAADGFQGIRGEFFTPDGTEHRIVLRRKK